MCLDKFSPIPLGLNADLFYINSLSFMFLFKVLHLSFPNMVDCWTISVKLIPSSILFPSLKMSNMVLVG